MGQLARAVQAEVEEPVKPAFVDQGYTGDQPAQAAAQKGIELLVVKHHVAKRGFVLLPRRWVLCLVGSIPSTGARLRTAGNHFCRLSLAGVCIPDAGELVW